MIFRMGRKDAESESEVIVEERLPDVSDSSEGIISKMRRMGFNTEEIVALMGSHTLGFAHEDRTGFKGRWTQNPYVFDNSYYKEVLLGEKTKFLRTRTEIILYDTPEMR